MTCTEHSAATRILAIRHGETAWNVDARIQGHHDVALNAVGRTQALRLGRALAAGERPDVLYSSDLSRARATAQAVADACGLPLHLDAGLRERCFGVFETCTLDEVQARMPEMAARWRRREPGFEPPGGESLQAFSARCVATVSRLAALHPGQTVALVAHGGVLDCLYRAAMSLPLETARSWSIDNTSVNRLFYTAGRLGLIGWGDVMHLEEGFVALDDAADTAA
jgi:probable phosphoglycerate mutase